MTPQRPTNWSRTPTLSWQIANVAGIPLRIHATFFLLPVFVFIAGSQGNFLMSMGLVLAVFACVVLHEYGHAFTARAFGIETRDVTLYPLGGVATLTKNPKPFQELWIALAGPAVNVVIAMALVPFIYFGQGHAPLLGPGAPSFLELLFVANLFLPLFNMLPAYPMDGGRVLRAILGMTVGEEKGGVIAGRVGQVLAVLMGIGGIVLVNPFLVLIALMVFMGAGREAKVARLRPRLEGALAAHAMVTPVVYLHHGQTLGEAAMAMGSGRQDAFPVAMEGEMVGVVTRHALAKALEAEGSFGYISGAMDREIRTVSRFETLEAVMQQLTVDPRPILVMDGTRVEGVLSIGIVQQFLAGPPSPTPPPVRAGS